MISETAALDPVAGIFDHIATAFEEIENEPARGRNNNKSEPKVQRPTDL